ncbi:MerR family transcriptional regulator [Enterococcus timonensis]|uniref:MerR family transcriptional regulator n=1 Tax=Enterococcus timonensis TaxID=1852364 RepID=UPI0008DA15D1|nr:MerR family transcriptional regulator [Enterococcus timonensis]
MREKELRRSLAVFPIGTVISLTDLTARKIRYYEDQGLIEPVRSSGNRRLYSLNDLDRLLEIKDYLTEGLNMAGIKLLYQQKKAQKQSQATQLTDEEVRKILYDEIAQQGGLGPVNPLINRKG